MNDIAILIDCWESPYSKKKFDWSDDYTMFVNIKKFIIENPSIKTIILATYQSVDTHTSVWYKNSKEILSGELFERKYSIIGVNPFPLHTTAEVLLNWEADRYQIALHDLKEFEILVSNTPIDNIYFCGQSLEECVRNRPLGYESIATFIKDRGLLTKLLLKDVCVNYENGFIFNLTKHPDWQATNTPGIFEYVIT